MERLALYKFGPFCLNHRGNTFVLVVTNFCTKWTERYPFPNQEASKVAEKLVEVICHFAVTYTTSPSKMAYWSSFNYSIGETPNMLMLGREIEVPLDV